MRGNPGGLLREAVKVADTFLGTGEIVSLRGSSPARHPREDGVLPDVYMAMGQTAENVALYTGISREEQPLGRA